MLCNKKDILYLPKVEKFNYSVYAQYTIVVKNRKKLLKALIEKTFPFQSFIQNHFINKLRLEKKIQIKECRKYS